MALKPKKKRRTMKGMFQRGDVWYFRVQVNGRRQSFSTNQTDYKLAEITATELSAQVNRGQVDEFIERKKATTKAEARYATFAAIYVREVSAFKRFKNAAVNDAFNLRASTSFFGDVPLSALDGDQCKAFVEHARALKSSKNEPYRANCIRNFINATRMVFAEAIKRGLLSRDPWEDVNRRQVIPRGTRRERVITLDEQSKVIQKMGAEERRAFIVMLGTGVREDELLRLEERHCDFSNSVLRLTGDVVKGKAKYAGGDADVAREIPMQPPVTQALKEQIAARAAGEVGTYCRRKQGPQLWNMSNTTVSERFTVAILAAEIERFTQHDCRRTFATRCAEAGVKPHKLQAWMGHADISTTMKFYVHLKRQESRDEMMRLDIGLPAVVVSIETGRRTGTDA